MNVTVTARVPAEVKAQVDRTLKTLGSSTTELINAAYDYVLNEGRLPRPQAKNISDNDKPNHEQRVKALSKKDAEAFKNAWSTRSVLQAPEYDGSNFKELLGKARDEHDARLA